MWFGEEQGILGDFERVLLLITSSATCLTIAQVWATRPGATFRAATAILLAMAAFSAYFDAPEFVFLAAGQLLTLLALRQAAGGQQPSSRSLGGTLFFALALTTAIASAATARPMHAWRWALLGVVLGGGAHLIDFGITRRRWKLAGSAACLTAIGLAYAAGAGLRWLEERLATDHGLDPPFPDLTLPFLTCTLLLYGVWRFALRLLQGHRGVMLDATGPDRPPIPRWRILVFGPAVTALALLITTPPLEAIWRLKPLTPNAQQTATPPLDTFAPLVTIARQIEWNAGESAEDGDSQEADEAFALANYQTLLRLEQVLSHPLEPPIDYRRGAEFLAYDHEMTFKSLVMALKRVHRDALRSGDASRQLECIRLLLLLKQQTLAGGLRIHAEVGDIVEHAALVMAYESRNDFTLEHARTLIAQISAAVASEEPRAVRHERATQWAERTESWRRRFFNATRIEATLASSLASYELEVGPLEQVALRATLIAELAMSQYARHHDGCVPESLAELVPDYLPTVPLDPFTDRPLLIWRADEDDENAPLRYAVYSIGPDKEDNHGEPNNDIAIVHEVRFQ